MLSSYLPLLNLYSYTFPSFFNTFPFLQSSSLIHILSFYILLHIYPPSSFSYASYPPTYFSYTYPILLSPSPKSVQSSNIVLLYLSFPKIPYLSINPILLCLSYPQIPISYIPILSSNPLLLYLSYPPIPFSYTYHILQSPSPIPTSPILIRPPPSPLSILTSNLLLV